MAVIRWLSNCRRQTASGQYDTPTARGMETSSSTYSRGWGISGPAAILFPPWLMGAPNDEVKTTEEMWAFFEAHPLEIEQ